MDFSTQPKEYFWNCWKLRTNNGEQFWEFEVPAELNSTQNGKVDWNHPDAQAFLTAMDKAFVFESENPNSADIIHRFHKSQPTDLNTSETDSFDDTVDNALHNGWKFYETLQEKDGNWAGDYGGPLFLVPGIVFAAYISGHSFSPPETTLFARHIWNHQNEDGGWGIHIEGKSMMFGTVMQYVTLRLLGVPANDDRILKAKHWILSHGGATHIPQWGKFYLSLLNLYDWKGNDALLPELWKLPKWIPFHPGKFWCHNRMIVLGMTYCYGHKIQAPLDELLTKLRTEIYREDFDKINWKKARKQVCKADVFHKPGPWYHITIGVANFYEKIHSKRLRKKSLKYTEEYIEAEDVNTNYINIGPVSQAINTICIWHQKGKDSQEYKKHISAWKEYFWLAEDGFKMNGYNGSQLWDTCFAGQAILEAKMHSDFSDLTNGIGKFIQKNQVDRNPPEYEKFWGTNSKGCWPFSTNKHGWPITDCSSEGMKTALLLNDSSAISSDVQVPISKMNETVDWLLSVQNKSGGWASYERKRAPKWIEFLNASMLFENIMVEVPYVECTSACIQGLSTFSKFSDYRKEDIRKAIQDGNKFIQSKIHENGMWYGSWAVCFTYGTWFGIEGLIASGEKQDSNVIQSACKALLNRQNSDGSWGEAFESCIQHEYIPHENGQIVNTAWAVLALMKANHPDKESIKKGIDFIIKAQEENGDFPQEAISGVFNGNCAITYSAYRNIFPLWAIARWRNFNS